MSRKFEDTQSTDSDSDKEHQSNKVEVGIPTTFTPVPSDALSILDGQKQRALPRDPEKSIKSIFVRVYFQQELYISFEIPGNRSIGDVMGFVLKMIGDKILDKFNYYLFASPCEIVWKRPQWEFMRKPPPPTAFRHSVKPNQTHISLADYATIIGAEMEKPINFYIFIKKWKQVEWNEKDELEH